MTYPCLTVLRRPILAFAALGIALGVTALAPETKAQTQQQAQQESQNFSDSQLQAFAQASVNVQQIAMAYKGQFEAAGSATEQQALQQQQMDEMVKAVESTGLQVADYNAIQQAYTQDKNVQTTVDGYIQQELQQ